MAHYILKHTMTKTMKISERDHERLDKARRLLSAGLDEDLTFGETAGLLSQSLIDETPNFEDIERRWGRTDAGEVEG